MTRDDDPVRRQAYATAFADPDFPDPGPTQRAELERLILAAIAADGREVVAWARIQRQLPERLRPYASSVLTAMWLDGKVWTISNRGRWQVALGDEVDAARANRDRAVGSVTAPRAV